jgi:hypothetical protein
MAKDSWPIEIRAMLAELEENARKPFEEYTKEKEEITKEVKDSSWFRNYVSPSGRQIRKKVNEAANQLAKDNKAGRMRARYQALSRLLKTYDSFALAYLELEEFVTKAMGRNISPTDIQAELEKRIQRDKLLSANYNKK